MTKPTDEALKLVEFLETQCDGLCGDAAEIITTNLCLPERGALEEAVRHMRRTSGLAIGAVYDALAALDAARAKLKETL